MKCQECERVRVVLMDDPRDPPLDTDPCLCGDCYRNAVEELVEELEARILELQTSLMV
jgi:hypothetical protein